MARSSRRGIIQTGAASLAAVTLAAQFGIDPARAQAAGEAAGRSSKPLKAAFSNAGLQATWCAQGKRAAEIGASCSTWRSPGSTASCRPPSSVRRSTTWRPEVGFRGDPGLRHRHADRAGEQDDRRWHAGDRHGHADRAAGQINIHSFIAPDNDFMGASVTQALVDAINGKGNIIMTQGALGHTGAQGRARGFNSIVKKYPEIKVLDTQPADWDVTKVARIWETLLTKYPKIDAAYFHNDDMALAAYNVMKAHNRTEIKIGGCDAMPPALEAVTDGRMPATVRNPSCRIHGGAMIAAVAAVVSGEKTGQGPAARSLRTSWRMVRWLPRPMRLA